MLQLNKDDKQKCFTVWFICFSCSLICFGLEFVRYAVVTKDDELQLRAPFNASNPDNSTIITPETVSRWGEIPGQFGTTQTENITIATFPDYYSKNPFTLGDSKTILAQVSTTRSYTNTEWSDDNSTFTYTPEHQRTFRTDLNAFSQPDDKIKVLNYASMSIYNQMTNPQDCVSAWQSASFVFDKIYNQSFRTFFYAYNSYQNFFDDQTSAFTLMGNLTDDQKLQVYSDGQFGLNSTKSLTWYVDASLNGNSTIIIDHFEKQGITLDLTDIIDKVATQISTINTNLVENQVVDSASQITNERIGIIQFQQNNLLNLALLSGVSSFNTMNDLGMDFIKNPEIQDNPPGNMALTFDEWLVVLAPFNETDPSQVTLLRPENMYQFYYDYQFNQTEIPTRLGITEGQTNALYIYINSLIDINNYSGKGTILAKTIEGGLNQLYTHLPIQLASRSLALFNQENKKTCLDYMDATSLDLADKTQICAPYDFTNVTDILFFVSGPWYGDYSSVQKAIELNEENMDAFYNATNPDSFYSSLVNEDTLNAAHFGCYTENCTASELAFKQWGAANITLDPRSTNTYMPKSTSLMGWITDTIWPIEGITVPMEYSYYTSSDFWTAADNQTYVEPFLLNMTQVGNISDPSYSWYGLTNQYNSMIIQNGTMVWDYWELATAQFQMSVNELRSVLRVLEYAQSYFLFQGPVHEQTVQEVVEGYQTNVTDLINTGSLSRGNVYIDNRVNPVFLEDRDSFSVMTGAGKNSIELQLSSVGELTAQNGQSWKNNQFSLWNGTEFILKSDIPQSTAKTYDFQSSGARQPASVTPNDNATDFQGWDTRFDNSQGLYELEQTAGPTQCLVTQEHNDTCYTNDYTTTNSTDYLQWFSNSTEMAVTGLSSWKLPYSGTFNTSLLVDIDTGYTVNMNNSLTWVVNTDLGQTPFCQIADLNLDFVPVFNMTSYTIVNETSYIDVIYPQTEIIVVPYQTSDSERDLNRNLIIAFTVLTTFFLVVTIIMYKYWKNDGKEDQKNKRERVHSFVDLEETEGITENLNDSLNKSGLGERLNASSEAV